MQASTLFRQELVHASVFIAENATVLGDVTLEQDSSVWFGTIVRADLEVVKIGPGTNIQDLCVLHADPGYPCILGRDVTVGHAAIVHGAIVEDNVMIGMRAVVLNGATIGSGSIIAAGAVVPEGARVPPNSLVMGIPARVKRETTEEDLQRITHAAQHYVQLAQQYSRKTDNR